MLCRFKSKKCILRLNWYQYALSWNWANIQSSIVSWLSSHLNQNHYQNKTALWTSINDNFMTLIYVPSSSIMSWQDAIILNYHTALINRNIFGKAAKLHSDISVRRSDNIRDIRSAGSGARAPDVGAHPLWSDVTSAMEVGLHSCRGSWFWLLNIMQVEKSKKKCFKGKANKNRISFLSCFKKIDAYVFVRIYNTISGYKTLLNPIVWKENCVK